MFPEPPGTEVLTLLETKEISGGVPLGVIKRRLRLPTDPD